MSTYQLQCTPSSRDPSHPRAIKTPCGHVYQTRQNDPFLQNHRAHTHRQYVTAKDQKLALFILVLSSSNELQDELFAVTV